MKTFIKKTYLYIAVTGLILVGGFQNCTRTQFDIVSKVETQSLQSSATYALDVGKQESVTDEVIHVMLVIDNSQSMKASVERLSRNIDSVLDKVKYLNAKVRIITTDEVSKRTYALENVTYHSSIANKVVGKISRQQKIADQKIYTYTKDSGTSDAVTEQIKQEILNIPLDGGASERPLLSIATAIELDEFIPGPDVPTIIYLITNEDSSDSIHEFFNPLVSHAILLPTARPLVPRTYRFNYSETGENGTTNLSNGGADLETCLAVMNGFIKDKLKTVTKECYVVEAQARGNIEKFMCSELPAAYSAGKLNIQQAALYKNMISCVDSETWERDTSTTTQAKSVFGDGVLYAPNKIPVFVPAVKKYLDQKLGSKYIFAVSANVPGQSCQLSGVQSYANLLLRLQKLYSPEQFMVSSICEERDISNLLDGIAKKIDTIIDKEYKIKLGLNEDLLKIVILSKEGKRKLLEKELYIVSRNEKGEAVLKLSNDLVLDPEDQLELVINTKTTSVIKEVQ